LAGDFLAAVFLVVVFFLANGRAPRNGRIPEADAPASGDPSQGGKRPFGASRKGRGV
jgi:hypothetical protein